MTAIQQSPREQYLAANPQAAELQKVQAADIIKRIEDFRNQFRPTLERFVSNAEMARQIGILLIEFCDTLPGKRITVDFWQQLKGLFKDRQGKQIEQHMLEWYMVVAKQNPEPIKTISDALIYRQPLLLAIGEIEQEGRSEPQRKSSGRDPLKEIKGWFDDLESIIADFRKDRRYCPSGHVREDLKPLLRLEWEPKKRLMDQLWEELQNGSQASA